MKIIVYHRTYGCDTGCCGHAVEMGDRIKFHFDHPFGDDHREFAEDLVAASFGRDHIEDLDWDNCVIVDSD